MDRDQSRGRGPLRPFADPADMAGVAQRNRGKARGLAFSTPMSTACGAMVWPKPKWPSITADDGRIDQTFDRSGREQFARCTQRLARHADDAMAVMAGQIGVDQGGGDAARLLGASSRRVRISRRRNRSTLGGNVNGHVVA